MLKRNHEFGINDLIPTTFLENNRTLLRDYKFKFEGLEPCVTDDFVRIVKDLGAAVCDNADYILTDDEYFQDGYNIFRSDLYSLEFIKAAVESEELPDIGLYKFKDKPMNSDETDKGITYFNGTMNGNFSDSSKIRVGNSKKDSPAENGHCSKNPTTSNTKTECLMSVQRLNTKDTNISSIPKEKQNNSTEFNLKNSKKRKIEEISDSLNYNDSSDNDSSDTSKSKRRYEGTLINKKVNSNEKNKTESPSLITQTLKKVKNELISSSEKEMSDEEIEIHDTVEYTRCSSKKSKRSFKRINKLNSSSEEETNERINKQTPKTKSVQEKRSVRNSSAEPTKAKTNISKWINTKSNFGEVIKITKDNQKADTDHVKVEEDDEEGEEKVTNLFRIEWWKNHPVPEEYMCMSKNCSFEPGVHERHQAASKIFSMREKKILLKYLITRNMICSSKGARIYEQMKADGYLTHRTVESLRNCFRRTIFRHIGEFNLPENILDELLSVEKR